MRFLLLFTAAIPALTALSVRAQTQNLLRDGVSDAFRPVTGWHGAAEVTAVPGKKSLTVAGNGRVLVNNEADGAPYLLTKEEFGDVRVELEFMIPQGSNSGVYLMGRYEVQILDSFGRAGAGPGDLGGIYERWDASRPEGQQGFGGVAPKSNAARPPGEWQTLDITFRAPRFDGNGTKLKDAMFEKVLVNGVAVQEGVSTSGPTRSAPLDGEAARGPVAVQGDHGPIAIRSFRVTLLDEADQSRLAALDAYWATVSRAVKSGDFDAYARTCHAEGVLVIGSRRTSQPLATALKRWRKEFDATREGKMQASVEFRLASRSGDATTAYETGIFLYTSQVAGGPLKKDYVYLEALLVKQQDGWKILMEHQKGPATEAEWESPGK